MTDTNENAPTVTEAENTKNHTVNRAEKSDLRNELKHTLHASIARKERVDTWMSAALVIAPDRGKEELAQKVFADVAGEPAEMPADTPAYYDANNGLHRDDASLDSLLTLIKEVQGAPQGDEEAKMTHFLLPTNVSESSFNSLSEAEETELINRLASMKPLEYARMRKDAAKQLGVGVAVLDKAVKQETNGIKEGPSLVEQTDPYHLAVNPEEVLNEIRAAFNLHAILPPHADVAMTLWVVMTWFIDALQIAALLIIRSPESECGKTTVKDLVQQFVRRPLSNEGVTTAALFRVVEQEQPTLLLDDADSWLLLDPKDERHSLINSGHKRGGRVLRCVGKNHDLKAFSTFCAKVIAFIGKSKDTLHNRSIEIVLRRKMAGEKIVPLRNASGGRYELLRAKLARMEVDYWCIISKAKPTLPAGIDNRAADNWEALFAIADIAGGEWPSLANKAALALIKGKEPVVSIGVEMLADIQQIFETKRIDKIRTVELVQALCDDSEAAWATYNQGKQASPRQISKILEEYQIKPKTIRFRHKGTAKGYELGCFQDAFARYLHILPENVVSSVTPSQPNNNASLSVTDKPSQNLSVTQSVTLEPSSINDCYGVTDGAGEMQGNLSESEYRK